jgi:hypothetical protein
MRLTIRTGLALLNLKLVDDARLDSLMHGKELTSQVELMMEAISLKRVRTTVGDN